MPFPTNLNWCNIGRSINRRMDRNPAVIVKTCEQNLPLCCEDRYKPTCDHRFAYNNNLTKILCTCFFLNKPKHSIIFFQQYNFHAADFATMRYSQIYKGIPQKSE